MELDEDKIDDAVLALLRLMQIPPQAGRVFRDEAGQGSGMKPATVPI